MSIELRGPQRCHSGAAFDGRGNSLGEQAFAKAFGQLAFVRGLLVLALILLAVRPAAATIRYRVSFDHPEQHLFHVAMTLEAEQQKLVVALPAWNALYQVRDFSYRVRDLHASAHSQHSVPLQVVAVDKQTWRIFTAQLPAESAQDDVEIDYAIAWDDPGPFNSQINAHHAFINLAEILMYVPDGRAENTEITFQNVPADWKIISELPAGASADSFVAPSYDALVDAPVEAGKFDEFAFDNSGAHFRVVVDADDWNNSSKRRLEEELRRITAYELHLMAGPPFQEYTFFFHIGPYAETGGGGMEHSNSTAIAATTVGRAAAIAAHEFFHAWNVKRIRPQSLEPVDYTKEQYTRALWFAEGVTSTYAAYVLERSGLWSKDQFYADLSSQVCELQSRPARLWQSVENSSLDAWLEKYDAYREPDRSISYYNKGQILGVLLDLAIRNATNNHKSLDDVMRRMNDEYAKAGKFYDDGQGIRAVVEEASGRSFEDFFRRYVSGTNEIPYNDFLAAAGLKLTTAGTRSANSDARSDLHCSVTEIAHPTDRQRRIRDGLLHGETN
jgi:predicted metalloprotease with PDZ domain